MARPLALAVDIGGTKLAVGLVDDTGAVVWSARAQTPQQADGEQVWAALAEILAAVPGGAEVCGVGCGGPMDPDGEEVSPLNIPGWRRFALRSRVASTTGLPTWVDNDAKALALAEGWCGSARAETDYMAMVVSTGVGGGIVLGGRLLDGAAGNAGHVGHVIVEPDGRMCPCGARGCLEAEASGMSIAAMTGRPAAEGDGAVRRRTGTMVGRAVGSVANLLDLRLATVAGSVALGYGEDFFTAAQQEVSARCRLDFSTGCRVVRSRLGAEGPTIGAAAVGWRGAGRLGKVGGPA